MAVCNACCCCSLRIGVIIIILLELCFGGLGCYSAMGQVKAANDLKEWTDNPNSIIKAQDFGFDADKATGVLAMNYLSLILAIATMLSACLLIYPVIPESPTDAAKRRVFLLPYVWICASKIAFALINVIFTFVVFSHPLVAMVVLVGAAFSILGSSYFLIMVYSFFQTIRDSQTGGAVVAGGPPEAGFQMDPK